MYLMRLDDACAHWNKENWQRMHDILNKYNIKPLVAIIPFVEDKRLLEYPEDETFVKTIKGWIEEGWTPALHGFNHVLVPSSGGLNPVNYRSEFVDLSANQQQEKISKGYGILSNLGIKPRAVVAPAHSFDQTTLNTIKQSTDIRVISDTVANDIYYDDGFYFVPQQSGRVREMNFKVVTFCYHPNNTTEEQFEELRRFLENHRNEFVGFDDLKFTKRNKSIYDKALSFMYFSKRKLKGIKK